MISRVAVNKSVSCFQYSTRRERSVPPDFTGISDSVCYSVGSLRSCVSEGRLNALGSPLHAPDRNTERSEREVSAGFLPDGGNKPGAGAGNLQQSVYSDRSQSPLGYSSSKPRQLAELRIQKIREMRNKFLGIETKDSVSSWSSENTGSDESSYTRYTRSQSLEPEIHQSFQRERFQSFSNSSPSQELNPRSCSTEPVENQALNPNILSSRLQGKT